MKIGEEWLAVLKVNGEWIVWFLVEAVMYSNIESTKVMMMLANRTALRHNLLSE